MNFWHRRQPLSLAFFSCFGLFSCSSGPSTDQTAQVSASLLAATDDARSTDANVVVALANPANAEAVCSGILLTPSVVLTARACVAADRAGLRPVVLVGATTKEARGYLAAKDAVVMGADGALAVVFLDPHDPVIINARISRPPLAAPAGVSLPVQGLGAFGAYRLVTAAIGRGAPPDGLCSSDGARQAFDLSGTKLSTFAPAGAQPFWVRNSSSQSGALSSQDVGSPIFLEAQDGSRQVIGIASAAGSASPACAAASPGATCDAWAKLTASISQKLLLSTVRRATALAPNGWLVSHQPVASGPDGVRDWWVGELGYQGFCRSDVDYDCDHWLDEDDGTQVFDNCAGVYNPDQADADGNGVGDACECTGGGDKSVCGNDNLVFGTGRRIRAIEANVIARAAASAPTAAGKALAQDVWSLVDDAKRLLAQAVTDAEQMIDSGGRSVAEIAALRAVVDRLVQKRTEIVAQAGLSPTGLDSGAASALCNASIASVSETPEARLRFASRGFSQQDGFGRESLRYAGDVNGDGKADLVAVSEPGTEVALSDGSRFLSQGFWSTAVNSGNVGNYYKTAIVDITGDGLADLVTNGEDGLYFARSTGSSFEPLTKILTFPPNSVFLREPYSVDHVFGDINGDKKADFVALTPTAVFIAKSDGKRFGRLESWLSQSFAGELGANLSGRSYPRSVADVNGDGLGDLVAFGTEKVWVSINSNGKFLPEAPFTEDFSDNRNFFARYSPRLTADVDGDKKADLIAIDRNGAFVATSLGTSFEEARAWAPAYTDRDNWNETWYQPRVAGDVDGDGHADVIGFGLDGVYVLRAVDGALR